LLTVPRSKSLLFCATALLGLLGSACRGRESPNAPLVVALESMPQNLDPRFSTDAASARIDDLVFRSLTQLDEHQQHVPDLAVDWRFDDSLTISFRLRTDATFDDGSPLTSEDVLATYESILDPLIGSPKREDLAFLESIDAPDTSTVRFRLREPYAPFLEATTVGILPRTRLAGAKHPRDRFLVGAGPFRIAEIIPNQEVRLEARPGHPGLGAIVFRVIPDDTVRALEVDRGSVRLVENAIEPENLRWLAARSKTCTRRIPGTTFQYVGVNLSDPRLQDVRVRQAIARAIDRETLIEHLLGGAARPATGLLSPGHWAYDGDVTAYPHDPAGARRLLDEAGYPDPDGDGPGMRFRVSYKTTTLDSRRRIGEALQAMLGAVGIGLDIRSFEWGTFYDDIRRGSFQLYSLAWVGVNDPDFYFSFLHSSMTPPRGNNRGGYSSPEIDRLTLLGRRTLDPGQRQRIYSEIQKITAGELPVIPLWWTDNVVVQDPRLCGFVPRPDGSLISLATAWWNETGASPAPGSGPCGCGVGQ
jgi:peptide/nickel transport system substrate-binding protein